MLFRSPYGTIAVDWKLQSNQLNLRLTIPPGTTATVCMPDSAVSCRIDGRKVNVKNKTFMVEGGKFNIVFDLSCS